jgi:mannose-6-phosphate isomerase-like protein (cupin superfamily)
MNYQLIQINNMKKGFKENIEDLTKENNNFRKVLYTAEHCQLVLMSLLANEEIGMEVHPDNDQFFRFEKGSGKVIINETEYVVTDGDAVIVPCGSNHNVIAGIDGLRMYTIYSPAHHKDGVIHTTKVEAESSDEEFDGVTTE